MTTGSSFAARVWPNVLRTVHTRAISEIPTPSDLRSRRISAQSSTISTCFLVPAD
jgi:hypothetical protein